MLEREKILHMFADLAGLEIGEAAAEQTLCDMAAAGLECRMLPDVQPQDREKLCYAAAAGAFYRYCLVQASREGGTVKIGDVSVSPPGRDAVLLAKSVYDEALALVSGLVTDDGFLFSAI